MKCTTIALLLCLPLSASAEIFKWTDANGKVHFGDDPPSETKPQEVQVEINSYTQVTIEPSKTTPTATRNGTRSVVMYSTPWCGYCKKAREYFKAHHIPYKDNDIESSASAKKTYDAFGGQGVPVIFVGRSRMNGFSEEGFHEIYGK